MLFKVLLKALFNMLLKALFDVLLKVCYLLSSDWLKETLVYKRPVVVICAIFVVNSAALEKDPLALVLTPRRQDPLALVLL